MEKEIATHSSILAWEIPWTEEPGRLTSPWGHKESGLDLGIKQQKEREDCGKAGPPGSFLFLLLTCMGFILFCVVITKMYFGFCTFSVLFHNNKCFKHLRSIMLC